MNLYVALCGNRYSEMLANSFVSGRGELIIHRSNANSFVEKIKRVLVLFFVLALRYLAAPLFSWKLYLIIPHIAGNYGSLMRMLKPHHCILMDDGVTFEYWSDFHGQNILPILSDTRTFMLLGPRQPSWMDKVERPLDLFLTSRRLLVEGIIKSYSSNFDGAGKLDAKIRTGWIVDDGQFLPHQLDKLKNDLCATFSCEDVLILWHPARSNKSKSSSVGRPAEVAIACSGRHPQIVVGRASTTLFNIKAYDLSIRVATVPSGYADLDKAALEQGMTLIDVG